MTKPNDHLQPLGARIANFDPSVPPSQRNKRPPHPQHLEITFAIIMPTRPSFRTPKHKLYTSDEEEHDGDDGDSGVLVKYDSHEEEQLLDYALGVAHVPWEGGEDALRVQ